MPDIKTRDTVKGTIKTLDKAAVAGERMKEAYVRTKDKAEHGVYSAESSPEEYAVFLEELGMTGGHGKPRHAAGAVPEPVWKKWKEISSGRRKE